MVSMGRAGLCVGLAIAALSVGGCGAAVSGEAGGSGTAGKAGTTSPAAPSTTSARLRVGGGGSDAREPSYGPAFPLTLRRTGGIAGFDDRILLGLDGRVRVETRSVHGRVCTLGAQQQRQLVLLLATVRLDPSGAGPSVTDLPTGDLAPVDPDSPDSVTDPIVISVTDAEARPIDLSDPSLGEVSGLVGNLVNDVTLSVPATTRCTTPSASTTPSTSAAAR